MPFDHHAGPPCFGFAAVIHNISLVIFTKLVNMPTFLFDEKKTYMHVRKWVTNKPEILHLTNFSTVRYAWGSEVGQSLEGLVIGTSLAELGMWTDGFRIMDAASWAAGPHRAFCVNRQNLHHRVIVSLGFGATGRNPLTCKWTDKIHNAWLRHCAVLHQAHKLY